MTDATALLAVRTSELTTAVLRASRPSNRPAADRAVPADRADARLAADFDLLGDAVDRFCADARALGIAPTTARHLVGALVDLSLDPRVDSTARRATVHEAERLVDRAWVLTSLDAPLH